MNDVENIKNEYRHRNNEELTQTIEGLIVKAVQAGKAETSGLANEIKANVSSLDKNVALLAQQVGEMVNHIKIQNGRIGKMEACIHGDGEKTGLLTDFSVFKESVKPMQTGYGKIRDIIITALVSGLLVLLGLKF